MTGSENQSKKNILENGKPTIAVLVGSLSSTYQEGIMRGAADAAKDLDYNLIGFACGPINSPDPFALNRETLFDLIDMDLFDGIIIPISSHTRYLDVKEKNNFVKKFNKLPLVNIGSKIEGCINIQTDYSKGIEEIIDHYVIHHNFKKIAFIRGPKNHATSNVRTDLFKKQLLKHNIEFDENLLFYSELNRTHVMSLAKEFVNSDGSYICDAIITINDNQALGIMESLQNLGLTIPEDIAVSGSMNIPEGLFSDPNLTTIVEPTYELGFTAIEILSAKLNGETIPSVIDISTSLLVRNSCGCDSMVLNNTLKHETIINTDIILRQLKKDCTSLLNNYRNTKAIEQLEHVLLLLKQGFISSDFTPFLIRTKEILLESLKGEGILVGLSIISEIQYSILKYIRLTEKNDALINLSYNLIGLKDDIEQKSIKFQNTDTDYYINHFREISNNLNSSFDLDAIKKYALDILDLSEFHISVYNFGKYNIKSATNFIAVRNKESIFIPTEYKTFNTIKLIPQNLPKFSDRYSLIILPLSFRKTPLGYLTLDLSNRKGTAYENMQAIISSALKNELQVEALKKAEERFSDIAHSTSNWLWETDSNHNFFYSSNSIINVLGYTEQEIIGKKITKFSITKSNSYFQMMLLNEVIQNVECWYKNKSGKLVCVIMSALPIFKNNCFAGYRGVFKDITEQKLQEEKIKLLAYSDVLTGLPNRAMFQENLERTINIASLSGSSFALIFLDIDRFKSINDSMGHTTGDLLLQSVAKILLSTIKCNDTIARLGGDEFTIILPNITADTQVIEIANRILKKLADPFILEGKQLYITASLGISIFPNDGEDSLTLLKKSDNAMYQAKSQGRNRYVFYDNIIEKKNAKRKFNEEILREALEEDRFIVYYQPQVNSITGKMLGLEALVRIQSKNNGIITPINFISLAEELDLIGFIDLVVLKKACSQYKEWYNNGFGKVRISLNISAVQLKNRKVVQDYMSIINEYNVDPKYIQFEITENTLISNQKVALQILSEFKEYGVSIALDDFGTGYSSLSCINLYPIDTVKIDRSFVIDSISNRKNKAIIQAIMHLAKNLNFKIVAEGVETKEQYELIKSLKCDEIQGYYFYKPCTVIEINEILIREVKLYRPEIK